jgi:hypothetical protein
MIIMNGIFWKTIFSTFLIGTGIAGSSILPAKADNPVNTDRANLILSQNFNYGDRALQTEPGDDLKNIVGITGLAIGAGVIAYHLSRAYQPSVVNLPTTYDRGSLLERINPKLRRELLRLVHDRQTADRLLSGTFVSHPDRSPNWLAEKVIYDLKRDR